MSKFETITIEPEFENQHLVFGDELIVSCTNMDSASAIRENRYGEPYVTFYGSGAGYRYAITVTGWDNIEAFSRVSGWPYDRTMGIRIPYKEED